MSLKHIPFKPIPSYISQILISSIFLTLLSINVFAQSPYIINRENPESGKIVHRALIEVNFKEGYTFKSSSNDKMKAHIDEFKITDKNYEDKISSSDIVDKKIQTSKDIGSIKGDFAIDIMGGANYSFGINLPKGINNMSPSLGVSYNSGAQYGLLGVGWNLSGISKITRVGQTLHYDDNVTPVKANYDDRYALDGQRLILQRGSTDYGKNNSEYATDNESFSLITAIGRSGKGPTSFIVKTKEGLRMDYGLMLDSDIEPDSRFFEKNDNIVHALNNDYTVLTWYLKRVTDLQGNYIEYKYRTSEDGSEIRLTEILYTGNDNENIKPFNRVKINYKKREDNRKYYLAGKKLKSTVLIRSIQVFSNSHFGSKYDFIYSSDGYNSYLNEVIKSGANGNELNSTVFKYGEKENEELKYNQISRQGLPMGSSQNSDNRNIVHYNGDFNGDGLNDFLIMKLIIIGEKALYSSMELYLNNNKNGNSGFIYSQEINMCQPDYYSISESSCVVVNFRNYNKKGQNPVEGIEIIIEDINGDGIDDIITGVDFNQNNSTNFIRYGACLSKINGNNISFEWSNRKLDLDNRTDKFLLSKDVHHRSTFSLGDFDGDGIKEFVGINTKTGRLYFTSFDDRINLDSNEGNTEDFYINNPTGGYLVSLDYDGDGVDELKYRYFIQNVENQSFRVYESFIKLKIQNNQIEQIFRGRPNFIGEDIRFGGYYGYNNIKIEEVKNIIDFNGDGLGDLMVSNNENYQIWQSIAYMENTDFSHESFIKESISIPNEFEINKRNFSKNFLIDINGDGLTDILQIMSFGNDDNSTQIVNNFLNTGKGNFIENTVISNLSYTAESRFSFGDINGDGNLELIYKDHIWTDINIIELNNENTPNQRLLKTIKDGLENTTHINYSTLSKGENYEFSLEYNSYPIVALSAPTPIVKSIEYSDKFGRSSEEHYNFKNALMHMGGKGFIGVMESEVNNPVLKTYNKTHNTLDDYYYQIVPHHQESGLFESGNYEKLSESNFEVRVMSNGGGLTRVYNQILEQKTVDLLSNFQQKVNYTYDSFNNIITQNTNINNGQQIINQTFDYEYGSTFAPLLSKESKTITRAGSPAHDEVIEYNYFDADPFIGLVKSMVSNPGADHSFTKNYTYDGFGNIIEEEMSSPGLTDKRSTYEMDNNGLHIVKTTDNKGTSKTMRYHKRLGLPIEIKTDIGLTQKREYDTWGRLTKSEDAFGKETTVQYSWDIGNGSDLSNPLLAASKLYKVNTSAQGKPSSTIWYDNHGREIMSMAESPAGEVTKAKSFDLKGNVFKETNVYGPTMPLITTYFYDDYNRPDRIQSPNGTTEYTYTIHSKGVKTTITNPDGSKTSKITDATGKDIEIEQLGETPQESSLLEYSYLSNGLTKDVKLNNDVVASMEYDELGNQTLLNDKNSGAINYKYNNYGSLTEQIDANGNKYEITYDNLGRKTKAEGPDGISTYTYVPSNQDGRFKIKRVTAPSGAYQEYEYDKFGRMTKTSEVYEDYEVTVNYSYNALNKLSRVEYSTGVSLNYVYDNIGTLDEIVDNNTGQNLYKRKEVNNYGQLTKFTLGNELISERVYDSFGMPRDIKTEGVERWVYNFELETGNLINRSDWTNHSAYESFEYDRMDRLEVVRDYNQQEKLRMQFESNGNISSKSDIGTYEYHSEKINAVEKVVSNTGVISQNQQDISYTPFNKIETISEGDYHLEVEYGVDNHRVKSVLKEGEETIRTKLFTSLGIEKIIEGDEVTELTYVPVGDAVAIYVNQNGNKQWYYVYKDLLGSFSKVTDEDGILVYEQSFDAWGRKTNPEDWNYENIPETPTWLRGYTGHEHLPEFDLINMNGRVYDPKLSRMLSPDNYVQSPLSSQSYNRYAYVWNNPLKYNDPSGDAVWLIPAAVGFSTGYLTHGLSSGNWGWSAIGAGALGAGTAVLGFYSGGTSSVASIAHGFSKVSTGHSLTVALGYSGRYAASSAISSIMPSFSIPISKNFNLSVSTGIGIGSGGFTGGVNVSGTYFNGKNSYTLGGGLGTNYKALGISASFNNGGFGIGYYRTYYGDAIGPDGISNKQIVGGINISSGQFAFRLENDFLGDGDDRWRSNAMEISLFGGALTLGTSLYNNDVDENAKPNKDGVSFTGKKNRSPFGAWNDGETYFSPGWIGLRSGNNIARGGISHPLMQDRTQNFVHKWGGKVRTNFFNGYDSFQRGTYSYYGYQNPYSLW